MATNDARIHYATLFRFIRELKQADKLTMDEFIYCKEKVLRLGALQLQAAAILMQCFSAHVVTARDSTTPPPAAVEKIVAKRTNTRKGRQQQQQQQQQQQKTKKKKKNSEVRPTTTVPSSSQICDTSFMTVTDAHRFALELMAWGIDDDELEDSFNGDDRYQKYDVYDPDTSKWYEGIVSKVTRRVTIFFIHPDDEKEGAVQPTVISVCRNTEIIPSNENEDATSETSQQSTSSTSSSAGSSASAELGTSLTPSLLSPSKKKVNKKKTFVDSSTWTEKLEARGWMERSLSSEQQLRVPTSDPVRPHLPSYQYRQLEMENTNLDRRVCPVYTKTRPPFLDSETSWILPKMLSAKVSNFRNDNTTTAGSKKKKKKSSSIVDRVGPSAARGLTSRPMHVSTKSRRVQKMISNGVPRGEDFFEQVMRKQEEERMASSSSSSQYQRGGSSYTNTNTNTNTNDFNGSRMWPKNTKKNRSGNFYDDDYDDNFDGGGSGGGGGGGDRDLSWGSGGRGGGGGRGKSKKKKSKLPPKLCLGVSEPGLVGKEVELGLSYNIKRKFLGKRAVVLGASPISGGAFFPFLFCPLSFHFSFFIFLFSFFVVGFVVFCFLVLLLLSHSQLYTFFLLLSSQAGSKLLY